MQILTLPEEVRRLANDWRKRGETIALVPTMGYFHAGHESLMKKAASLADKMIVSLFVNPTQFGSGEDLEKYPRDVERDRAIAEKNGCDVLFAPTPAAMYGENHQTWVEVPAMAGGLCGASRPGHFRGVCTVVLKLLMICQPDFAVFGEKDWQQQAIIRKMCGDLNLPVEIVQAPIAREEDGLALSSRNVYLSSEERSKAPHIHRGLARAAAQVAQGRRDLPKIIEEIRAYWRQWLPEAELDYLSAVRPETLEPAADLERDALLACAIRLGSTRLIDNILLKVS